MNIQQSIILFFGLVLIQGFTVQGQEKQAVENDFFSAVKSNQLESYVTFSQGIGTLEPLIFEAMIAPSFLLRTSADARYGATISTGIRLRMQAEESLPVRTPSYMPQITFYRQVKGRAAQDPLSGYLFLTLAHHSNGQDGDFFLSDGSVNTINGNFSTNYLEMGMFFNQRIVPFSNTTEYFKTSLEWHPKIDISPELEGRYGFLRWHNSLKIYKFSLRSMKALFGGKSPTWHKVPSVQTTLGTTWIFGARNKASFFDLRERFNLWVNIALRPKFLKDVSLFARFYTGEDYYNIFYYRRITYLQFGIQAFTF